jgi:hypothetical protein
MAHELYGDRFYGRQEEPAWHQLGHVFVDDLLARKAYETIGAYRVTVEPTYAAVGGKRLSLPGRVILRHPTDDDPRFVPFGTVGPEYRLITPDEACDIYDRVVGKPVETMGALKEGRMFFFSTKLPDIDVKGDDVEMYQLTVIPMDGLHVAEIVRTGVRVVCWNTLSAALGSAHEADVFRVVHDETAVERLEDWMTTMQSESEQRVTMLREAWALLTTHTVKPRELKHVIEIAYPTPASPRRDAPKAVIEKRFALFEQKLDRIERYRAGAVGVFKGEGRGQDSKAAKGTAWGLFNAVAEYEQWGRPGSHRGRGEDANVAEELLFGSRAGTVQRAFDECLQLVAKN